MNNYKSLLSFLLGFFAVFCVITTTQGAYAQSDIRESLYEKPPYWSDEYFIGSWDIKPGMTGVAKTVIFGTKIDEFKITVIQVGRDRGFNNHAMLFCRAEGWVVDFTGGIAGGMSGSPVYIDGRLAGAISGHWSNTDQKTCIVTPIDGMLPAWNPADTRFNPVKLVPPGTPFDVSPDLLRLAYPQDREASAESDVAETDNSYIASGDSGKDGNGETSDSSFTYYDLDSPVNFDGEIVTSLAIADYAGVIPPSAPNVVPMTLCATPVVVTSSNPALSDVFAAAVSADSSLDVSTALPLGEGDTVSMPLTTVEAFNGIVPDKILEYWSYPSNVRAPAIMEPGCLLGQRTMRGDLSSYGYGTLTYVDANGNFLAYGHRANRDGFIVSPAANGFVYYVPANWQRVGKRAVCLDVVGTVFQDRGGAIGGTFGVEPPWTPVSVYSYDEQTGEKSGLHCEVLHTSDYFPSGAASAVASGITFPVQRSGEGTVDATFVVKLDNGSDYSWRTVYNAQNALSACTWELSAFLEQAMNGEGERLGVNDILAVSKVSADKRSYRIAELRSLSKSEFEKIEMPSSGLFRVPIADSFESALPLVKSEKIDEWKLKVTKESFGRVYLMIKLVTWRSDLAIWLPVKITLPVSIQSGKVRLQVRGGFGLSDPIDAGDAAMNREYDASRGHIDPIRSPHGKSKSEWLADFTKSPRGQHLIVEFVYAGKPADIKLSNSEDLPFARKIYEFDGVVRGYGAAEVDFQ